jgi:hypothetical protein
MDRGKHQVVLDMLTDLRNAVAGATRPLAGETP